MHSDLEARHLRDPPGEFYDTEAEVAARLDLQDAAVFRRGERCWCWLRDGSYLEFSVDSALYFIEQRLKLVLFLHERSQRHLGRRC